jgi:proteic killer suppression protein
MPKYGRDLTRSFRKSIGLLESASSQAELRNFKGLRLEQLRGKKYEGCHSVRLNKQWRLIIRFKTSDAGQSICVVEIVDYH